MMLKISSNRRFLKMDSGAPFFWLGDTAWELFHRLTLAEAHDYLLNRLHNGFNVIQAVALAEMDGLNTPNANGDLPLIDHDPLRPNEAYFRHVDAIIDLAAQSGLYIGLLPSWGDKVYRLYGIGPQIFDEQNIYQYGHWIAERYANRANIIWIMGGDRPETLNGLGNAPAVWRSLAKGIRDVVGSDPLMTYHPCGGNSSATVFHNDEWLDLNMWQSGHSRNDAANWKMIGQDYARQPIKPVLDGEPCYEDHPIDPFSRRWTPAMACFTDYDVRKAAYRATFAGACGHTYGHHAVWQFFTPERAPVNFPQMPWRQAIERPGAAQLKYLIALLMSRPYFERIPDQTLLALDNGEGASHIQAARGADGSYAFIHMPQARQSVTIATDALNGETLNAWWFEPRSGIATALGRIARQPRLSFVSPDVGQDWVLILDDDSRGYPTPGSNYPNQQDK